MDADIYWCDACRQYATAEPDSHHRRCPLRKPIDAGDIRLMTPRQAKKVLRKERRVTR
jgi:hypothetical protein